MILVSSPLCISHHWLKDIRSWGWGRSEVASPPAKRWEMDLCWKPSAKFWRFFKISTSKGLSPWSKNYLHPLQDVILWHISLGFFENIPNHIIHFVQKAHAEAIPWWRTLRSDGCGMDVGAGGRYVCSMYVGDVHTTVWMCASVSRSYRWQS